MDSLVLIGIKHCGKSTLGRLLAQQYGLEFFDSDAELEKQFYMDSGSRCSCREIFKYLGEEKFRELEAQVIEGLVSDVPKVVALGGGAVSNPFLKRDILKSLGRIVWLDTDEEIAAFRALCDENDIAFDIITSHRDGKQGAISLAENVASDIEKAAAACDKKTFPSYDLANGLEKNIRIICKKFYEAENIVFSEKALERLNELIALGYNNIPVCMAKTPYALNDGSEDKNTVHIQDIALSAGAGFAVILTGDIMTMPGLPRVPQAQIIDFVDGKITGLM